MFTLSQKSVVINDASLINVSGNFLTIDGFGTIEKGQPGYTKVQTVAIPTTFSSIDLISVNAGEEVAIYWHNLRYIGEGMANMASKPQAPLVFMRMANQTLEEAWDAFQEAFGEDELFELTGNILTSKNAAIDIKSAEKRDVNSPTDGPLVGGTGFRYNRFQGSDLGGAIVSGVEGTGNWFQVEEGIRTWSESAVDPYSVKEHGSDAVERDALYDTYDFTLEVVGVDTAMPEYLGNQTPDQMVASKPIHLTIYAKQGPASAKVAGF